MYPTHLQFDVLFPLKDITGNYYISFSEAESISDEATLRELCSTIVQYSVQGVFGYRPYLDLKTEKSDGRIRNPIVFSIVWFLDIFNPGTHAEKIFHSVMEDYYSISRWEDGCPFNGDANLSAIDSFELFKRYALFDVEATYQKGIVTNDNFREIFPNNQCHLVDNGVILKTYEYHELYAILKDKFEYCVSPRPGYLIVDYFDRNDEANCLCGMIVDSHHLKTIDEYLASRDWNCMQPWQMQMLANRFGYDRLAKHCKPYLDQCYPYDSTVWLLIERAKQYDCSISDLDRWIEPFFDDDCSDRIELEMALHEMANDKRKQSIVRVYKKLLSRYLG